MDDSRIEFVQQWYKRSNEAIDDFEKFIFLWLCIVTIAKFWASENIRIKRDYASPVDDGEFINKYFKSTNNAEIIIKTIEKLPEFNELISRKSDSGDYIVESDKNLNPQFRDLYQHAHYKSNMGVSDRSRAIGLALRAIRNNLFHGGKLYDSSEDRQLLRVATPILDAIVITTAKCHMNIELESIDHE